jgi:hypothetical protein
VDKITGPLASQGLELKADASPFSIAKLPEKRAIKIAKDRKLR